ncbi:hypothetical protein [Solidesulfovibrio sp.]
MTITMHIDHRHINPIASLRNGTLEMPGLLAKLKPADTLRIVQRQTERMHQVVTAKALGMTG